jgi:ribosome biogenesis protein ERB1
MGIKEGRIQLNEAKEVDHVYDIWADDTVDEMSKYLPQRIAAAKAPLPMNVLSYNPPKEYEFTQEERDQWMATDAEDRELPFMP